MMIDEMARMESERNKTESNSDDNTVMSLDHHQFMLRSRGVRKTDNHVT